MQLEGMLKLFVYYKDSHGDGDEICYFLVRDTKKEESFAGKTKEWYQFVRLLMVEALTRFPKSGRLHMLYAYIQHEKLKNKYKSLFQLMFTEENKPSLQEEFLIYRYKNIIEEKMIESDRKYTEAKGFDVNAIVTFQNKFVVFQSNLEKSVTIHLSFWRELLEQNPDIRKLQGLGSKITKELENNAEEFRKLIEINPNHIKCLSLYGNFLKNVTGDEQEGLRIIEKAHYIEKSSAVNKQFVEIDRQKYGDNSNTCIITCSGNYNEMGVVTNCNNEITRILGFPKQEIIGQNISKIMPRVYANVHSQLMSRYFETAESEVIGTERLMFPLNNHKYMVPTTLMIKVLPNLDQGIRAVGFLREVEASDPLKQEFESEERTHYVMYGGEQDIVQGVTMSCYESFGIPSNLTNGSSSGSPFAINAIFPEFGPQIQEELRSPAGAVIEINTLNLQQDYLLGHNDSNDLSHFEGDEHKKEEYLLISSLIVC